MDRRHTSYHVDESPLLTASVSPYSLRVHQATGMVSVQASCSVAAALDLLIEHANKYECSIDELATAVIDRRIRLGDRPPPNFYCPLAVG